MHRWPTNSPHKGRAIRTFFTFWRHHAPLSLQLGFRPIILQHMGQITSTFNRSLIVAMHIIICLGLAMSYKHQANHATLVIGGKWMKHTHTLRIRIYVYVYVYPYALTCTCTYTYLYICWRKNWFLPIRINHWSRVTHICVGKLIIIGSDNGLSPARRQAIIWTNAAILLIRPLGTNIFIQENAFENIVCEMAFILTRPQCVNAQ